MEPSYFDDQQLLKKIETFAPFAEMMPGVVIIHQLEPFTPCYMTPNGLKLLGIDKEELIEIGPDYHKRFFNNEDMEDFIHKFQHLIESRDPNETFTFFQQVKFKERKEWVWHISSTRIFMQDDTGKPTHIVTNAIPIDQLKNIPNKAERLLAENEFFRTNRQKFLNLGNREKEVLRLVAIGKSSAEIADELEVSVETVTTQRKTIKQKLDIKSTYDFTLYAHAFDLI